MIDPTLLSILACPETKKNLELADENLISKVNTAIAEGKLTNRLQQKVTENLDGGLLRVGDNRYLYPIRNGIPMLLIEELIDLNKLAA